MNCFFAVCARCQVGVFQFGFWIYCAVKPTRLRRAAYFLSLDIKNNWPEMIKSIWKDPVWSSVIATTVVSIAGFIGSYFLGYWPKITSSAMSIWVFLAASSHIPHWVLGLLFLGITPTIFLLIAGAWVLMRRESGMPASWTGYTSDHFLGLRWRWRYVNGRINSLNSFCPYCDFQVFPYQASDYNFIDRIGFSCDSCKNSLGQHNESYSQLKGKVERFVQQKLRNKTWSSSTST